MSASLAQKMVEAWNSGDAENIGEMYIKDVQVLYRFCSQWCLWEAPRHTGPHTALYRGHDKQHHQKNDQAPPSPKAAFPRIPEQIGDWTQGGSRPQQSSEYRSSGARRGHGHSGCSSSRGRQLMDPAGLLPAMRAVALRLLRRGGLAGHSGTHGPVRGLRPRRYRLSVAAGPTRSSLR